LGIHVRTMFYFRGGTIHHFSDDGAGSGQEIRVPFFTADIKLAIPNVVGRFYTRLVCNLNQHIKEKNDG